LLPGFFMRSVGFGPTERSGLGESVWWLGDFGLVSLPPLRSFRRHDPGCGNGGAGEATLRPTLTWLNAMTRL
jgi:hypothetical protein